MTERDRALEAAISRIAGGDKSALADFYDICAAPVYAYSLSTLKSRHCAEDVLQDLVLEVWRCAGNYRSCGKPMAWVISVAKNLCRMRIRDRSKFSDIPPEDLNFEQDGGLSAEDITVLRCCLEKLGEREREVVIMHAVMGLKHREIAAILGLPLSTVLSGYQRAIKKLNRELEGALR